MTRTRSLALALSAATAASLLLFPISAATAAESDKNTAVCTKLQQDVDDYLAHRIWYFADPRPGWIKKAQTYGCDIHGLDETP